MLSSRTFTQATIVRAVARSDVVLAVRSAPTRISTPFTSTARESNIQLLGAVQRFNVPTRNSTVRSSTSHFFPKPCHGLHNFRPSSYPSLEPLPLFELPEDCIDMA